MCRTWHDDIFDPLRKPRMEHRSAFVKAHDEQLSHATAASAQYRVDGSTTEQGLPQNIVRAVHTGRDGYLWLTTLDGLVRFDGLRFTLFDRANSEGIGSNQHAVVWTPATAGGLR